MKKPGAKVIGLILGPLAFICTLLFVSPAGLSPEGKAILAGTLWIAIWWITEAIPIPVTSLLPIVLFPLTGALSIQTTTQAYAHPLVFLYVGGFIVAIAIERWNLHKRIALNIINLIGTNTRLIILGFMVATAFLSMWISNTATTVMMLPIGMAIVVQLGSEQSLTTSFGKALMLSIAYAASIGGVATIIGTPTNLVLVGVVENLYQTEITFTQWIVFGLPISVILLFICWQYMTRIAYPMRSGDAQGSRSEIKRQLSLLGGMTYQEKAVTVVFVLTAICWITRSFFLNKFLPEINDTIIAIAGATLLFLIPARTEQPRMLMTWKEAVKLPWGILLLFGGGFALASGFQETGLATWIGNQLQLLEGVHLFVLLLILIFAVNFLTEITSNVATASMILPILAAMAVAIGVHPYGLMVAATVAASCAFMLPVATPPNAVVFGSGYLRIPDMVRTGIWMNLVSIVLLSLFVYFLLPAVWGIDLGGSLE